jgi:uncharacterized membrane protein AbrB (regulator of aidB expression)
MTLRKTLFFICWGLSTLLAATGFWQIGFWQGEIVVAICAIAWLFVRKKFLKFCMGSSIAVAAAGLLLGVPSPFMFFYAGLSLACWDLTSMDLSLACNLPRQKTKLYQSMRLRTLGFALGAGIFTILLGRYLSFQIPFLVMVIFIFLAIFSFDRIVHALQHKE